MIKLFVGNIPHKANESDLKAHFEGPGRSVTKVIIIKDKVTGHSRGFGFVEFETEYSSQRLIDEFNGQRFDGRVLTVNEAHPQVSKEEYDRRKEK